MDMDDPMRSKKRDSIGVLVLRDGFGEQNGEDDNDDLNDSAHNGDDIDDFDAGSNPVGECRETGMSNGVERARFRGILGSIATTANKVCLDQTVDSGRELGPSLVELSLHGVFISESVCSDAKTKLSERNQEQEDNENDEQSFEVLNRSKHACNGQEHQNTACNDQTNSNLWYLDSLSDAIVVNATQT